MVPVPAKLNNKDPNATYVPDNSWLKVAFELAAKK